MEFKIIKGGKNMNTENQTNKEKVNSNDFKNGLKIITAVGLGAGYYGFKFGKKIAYRKGFEHGYITASSEFINIMKDITKEIKEAKGI